MLMHCCFGFKKCKKYKQKKQQQNSCNWGLCKCLNTFQSQHTFAAEVVLTRKINRTYNLVSGA